MSVLPSDHLYGMRVVESPLAVTLSGGKPLRFRSWHLKRGYAKRIEKKWAKRYGPVTYKPDAYMVRDPITGHQMIIAHPSIIEKIKLATGAR